MGQYFRPVVLDEDGKIQVTMASAWEFAQGAKLMEHSYLGNEYVQAFETLLVAEAPRRVVWAGDYADPEKLPDGSDLIVESDFYTAGRGPGNLFVLAVRGPEPYRPDAPGYAMKAVYDWFTKKGTRRKRGPKITWTRRADLPEPSVRPSVLVTPESHPWLVNWDKREYVDKGKVNKDKDGFRIHPLPLLTAEGNDRGGGDFDGEDPERLVGRWARDHISVHAELPAAARVFDEIKFNLADAR